MHEVATLDWLVQQLRTDVRNARLYCRVVSGRKHQSRRLIAIRTQMLQKTTTGPARYLVINQWQAALPPEWLRNASRKDIDACHGLVIPAM